MRRLSEMRIGMALLWPSFARATILALWAFLSAERGAVLRMMIAAV